MADTKKTAITQREPTSITYKLSNGESVTLNEAAVRKLTNNNQYITQGEISLFIETCKYQKLNPFVGEAYLVKYDSSKPASKVVSLTAFMRIADEQKTYDGIEDGIIVKDAKGNYVDREGCVRYPDEVLVGGWATVYRSDRSKPFKARVMAAEYNKGMAMWKSMPAIMINKVAKVTALRKAFPAAMNGCYIEEEVAQPKPTNAPDPDVQFDKEFDKGYDVEFAESPAAEESEPIIPDVSEQDFAEFDEAPTESGATKRIPYSEYSNNTSKYEKIAGSYDAQTKTIEVIEK